MDEEVDWLNIAEAYRLAWPCITQKNARERKKEGEKGIIKKKTDMKEGINRKKEGDRQAFCQLQWPISKRGFKDNVLLQVLSTSSSLYKHAGINNYITKQIVSTHFDNVTPERKVPSHLHQLLATARDKFLGCNNSKRSA